MTAALADAAVALPVADIVDWYREGIVDADRQPEFLFLVSFLVTFGFIRTSAHMIRAQVSWWPGNVQVGGTHVHHLVWGICLLLIVGYVGVAIEPPSPWQEVIAILFGVGVGLTLDEFALWLNLKDVYWSEQGRRSIDAVMVAAVLAGIMVIGFQALADVATRVEDVVFRVAGSVGALTLVLVAVNLAKQKLFTGIVGLLVPLVALVGALRLAKPDSAWARAFYRREKKRARAQARYADRKSPLDRLRERRASAQGLSR